MEVVTLEVEKRTAAGTNRVKALRDTGKIPMVLYGGGQDPVSLQAAYVDVKRHLEHHLRVYHLHLGDQMQPGYLQDVQWDCLTDEPLHMDFRRIEMDQPLMLNIELVLIGVPKSQSQGCRLIRDVQSLKLACLPAHVPEQIELNVRDLEPNERVFASDLKLPEGCSLNMPSDQQILHMTEIDEREPLVEEGEVVAGEEPAPDGGTPPAPAGGS